MLDSETDTENTSPSIPPYLFDEAPFTVLKKADVELKVGGKSKTYSVVIKVSNSNKWLLEYKLYYYHSYYIVIIHIGASHG